MGRVMMEFLALSLMMTALTVWAMQAHGDEVVRVRTPDGKTIEVMDRPGEVRWWQSADLAAYSRYYFVPAEGVYQVYDAPKDWPSPARWGAENAAYPNGAAGPAFVDWRGEAAHACPPGMPSRGVGTGCR